ncbi:MAG TPA: FliI/YscN family ATPase [Pirellulales bacterium]|jgi:flagellum-specific ATP synthase|nr:FliI/YscN family ATPase [Pirellulales bacterium]
MQSLLAQLDRVMPTALVGSVVRTSGMTAAVADFPAPVGALVEIERQTGTPLRAEVIGFRDAITLVYPYSDLNGVRRGNRVRLLGTTRWLRVGDGLLGRVVDAHGRAIDGRPQPALGDRTPRECAAPPAFERPRIDQPLGTGIRALDGMLTCGRGQRMGIFAGSGVGKSVLLGMMSRYTAADVNVIALVGERGREVNEFLERDLGSEGLARSVVVVATSDEPALLRVQAAQTATAIAEYFRDAGRDVLLIMDSLTRFAMAQREIGLAAGEPPTTRGYPPSVFGLLPKLVERAGRTTRGSITGFYSVLVEGDDPQEPIADAVRGLLDGHVWLSRKMAGRGHYPAIDILTSLSRLMSDITPRAHQDAALALRELLGAHRDNEDLISIGAYRRGSNRSVDLSIDLQDEMNRFLRQRVEEPVKLADAVAALVRLHNRMMHPPGAAGVSAAPATANAAPAAATGGGITL